jgi:hypothetical protein
MGKSDLVCGLPMLELRALLAGAGPGGHLGDGQYSGRPSLLPLVRRQHGRGRRGMVEPS